MLILGIETSTRQVSCALGGGGGVLASFTASRQQQHTEMLAPAIQHITRAAGVALADIDVVAVGLGPGLFTGLRVGVATGQALAQALEVPVVGVPTLDVVAHRLRAAGRSLLVAMDARRSELFWACFRPGPDVGLGRGGPDRVDLPQHVAAVAAELGPDALVVGDGPARYPAVFAEIPPARLIRGEAMLPSAVAVVELSAERLTASGVTPTGDGAEALELPAQPVQGLFVNEEVRPIYVRAPDAEAHWVERSGVVGSSDLAGLSR
jgi:tRNA threonylcarbamoyladenosine biosynthesis protein TsaB